uniref:Uncharacterized protein n=1 Tax=Rhizophora mucronata TaxID=61149 RepID=A0A2P2PCF9_RHIMU
MLLHFSTSKFQFTIVPARG